MEDGEKSPVKLVRTKSWKEYDAKDEIPFILNEGFLPVKFQANESVSFRFSFLWADLEVRQNYWLNFHHTHYFTRKYTLLLCRISRSTPDFPF